MLVIRGFSASGISKNGNLFKIPVTVWFLCSFQSEALSNIIAINVANGMRNPRTSQQKKINFSDTAERENENLIKNTGYLYTQR